MIGFAIAAALAAASVSAQAPAADDSLSSIEALRANIAAMQPHLPIVDGVVTIESVELEGKAIHYGMRVDGDFTDAMFAGFEENLEESACMDEEMRAGIADGVSFTYTVRDGEGDSFTATIDDCD